MVRTMPNGEKNSIKIFWLFYRAISSTPTKIPPDSPTIKFWLLYFDDYNSQLNEQMNEK
jgi:hypothetical protein